MATVASAKIAVKPRAATYKWAALANGDDGAGIELPDYPIRSVQVLGTFGTGGSVNLEGSNDGGTTWVILTDEAGSAITLTAAGLVQVRERTEQVRPNVTAGDGTTALDVFLHGTR